MLLLRQLGGDEDPRNIITDLDDEKEKHSTRSRWSQRIKPTAKAKPRDEQCVSNLTNPPRIEGGNNTGKNGRNRGEGEGEGGRSSHRTHQPLRLGVWSHRGLAGSRSLYAAAAAASAHRRLTADLDFFFFFCILRESNGARVWSDLRCTCASWWVGLVLGFDRPTQAGWANEVVPRGSVVAVAPPGGRFGQW